MVRKEYKSFDKLTFALMIVGVAMVRFIIGTMFNMTMNHFNLEQERKDHPEDCLQREKVEVVEN